MILKLLRSKSILAVLAVISLSLSSWANTVAWADNETVGVQAAMAVIDADSMAALSGAIAIVNANPETVYIINIQNDISMTSGALTVSNTAGVIIRSDMNLAGAPFTINRGTVSAFHFIVKGALTLENIVLDGNFDISTYSGNRYGGVDVQGGVFYLNRGAIIQNCNCDSSPTEAAKGGGVSVNSGGEVIVNGGTIRNNKKANTNGGGGVYVTGAGSSFTMIDGDISNNVATSTSTGYGGGIAATVSSSVTIKGGTISGNTAVYSGGGVSCGSSAAFTMTDGIITGNKVLGTGSAGTYYGGGVYATTGAVNITGGTISNNTVAKGNGGGVGIYSTSAMSTAAINISGVTISGNSTSSYGGGIYVSLTAAASTTVFISNGIISKNEAVNGGGIYVASSNTARSFITVSNSEISGNIASGSSSSSGGGIYGGTYSTIEVNNSTISDNEAINSSTTYGGGGIFGYTNSSVTVDNSRITGNTASLAGGGIYGYTGSGITIIGGSIIERNEAGRNGGGIYGSGSGVTVNNVTITGNTALSGHGGGIFGLASCYIDVTGGQITGNSAPIGDGGGIYTADTSYSHLTSSDTAVYSGNHARAAYLFTGTHYPDIRSASVSVPGTYVLNNYDINYTGGTFLDVYTVTYDANGGEGAYWDILPALGFEYTVLSPDDTGIAYPGHIFQGWSTAPDGSSTHYDPGSKLTVTGDIILYAQWLQATVPPPITYTVTYDSNGGEGSHRDTDLALGLDYTVLPLSDTGITYPGHIFQGWNTAPDGSGTNYPANSKLIIAGDIILYARWLPETAPIPVAYTVTYDANGGYGSHQDVGLALGSEYTVSTLSGTGITNPGHIFQGWNTEPDGSGTHNSAGSVFTVSGDIMLYAQWSVNRTGNIVEGTRKPYSYAQDWLMELEDPEVPLKGEENTTEANKIPQTGAISSSFLLGISCLLVLCGIIFRSKSRIFRRGK